MSGPRRVLPAGDRAVLAEVGGVDEVLALHAALSASRPDGVIDLVPAARTVLVRVDPRRLSPRAARVWIERTTTDAAAPAPAEGAVVDLEVVYDGPDLAETATLVGVAAAELVRRHLAAAWTVAFTGFAPGFGYLVSPDWPYDVPRLEFPRTRVPAGAVGLAAGFTGAYPRETPGGWRLIATTRTPLFDADAASPALLAPGTRVRMRETAPAAHAVPAARTTPAATGPGGAGSRGGARLPRPAPEPALTVVEAGLLATVQDLGRPGVAHLGVAVSGALDRAALRTANRLVGNDESAAGIEVTLGGFRATALRDLWIAVCGAWGAIAVEGRRVDPYTAHAWAAGAELSIDWFSHGARGYLAVRGGIAAVPVLGSRATDLLAGLGPPPLRAGDSLAAGAPVVPVPPVGVAPWSPPQDDLLEIPLVVGPRADWFAGAALDTLYDAVWTVTGDADRVGMRLDGPVLERLRPSELPSEGMVPGALQVPPRGRPTILLADGPVTGGYPVIAVATDAALDLLAQARPGSRIRFRHAPAPR